MELELTDLLDVVDSYRIDDHVATAVGPPDDKGHIALFNRARVKAEDAGTINVGQVPKSIDDEDPETWGTAPEQQAAVRAAIASIGPPAGPVIQSGT